MKKSNKTVKMNYQIWIDGDKRGTTQVTVPNNVDAYNVAEQKLRERMSKRFPESDHVTFNHAGKTVSVEFHWEV